MNGRTIRARILLEEARVLGLDLADLIAADVEGASRLPTVSAYIETIAPTFTAATAATYRPYWRLTAAHLGGRRLTDITVEDLLAVVDAAAARAQRQRPGSTGRASRESCVAACEPCSAERSTPDSSPSTPPPSSPNPDGPAAAAEPSTTRSSAS